MNTFPFPQLQAFLAVARAKSFSGGARELGVSRSAVSQSVRQLEEETGVVLVARTTRSVSLTDAGRRLLELAGPAFAQARVALDEVSAKLGEVVGRVRLTVPRAAFYFVLEPVLPTFRERHPRIQLELVFEDRRVDIVGEGYDAGIRLSEFVERDMVSVRLTDAFRFVVVGAPSYLEKHGTPERPENLLHHECLTFRSDTTGSLYAWELERGRKTWRVPVRGSVITNDGLFCIKWAEQGLGLSYMFEPLVAELGAVKEQSSGLYAQTMAERGFVTWHSIRPIPGKAAGSREMSPRPTSTPRISARPLIFSACNHTSIASASASSVFAAGAAWR